MRRATSHLHVEEAVPAAQRELAPRVRRVGQVEVAVDGDRVVEGREHRPAVALDHLDEAAAEALVVVHEVEVGPAGPQHLTGPQRERVRLGEPRRAHDGELLQVDPGAELPRPRHPERVLGAVEVEARDLHELRRVVELGVRRAGEDRHLVAELGQLAGQVPRVDALPATVRVPPVHEPGDAQGRRRRSRKKQGHEGVRLVRWPRGTSQPSRYLGPVRDADLPRRRAGRAHQPRAGRRLGGGRRSPLVARRVPARLARGSPDGSVLVVAPADGSVPPAAVTTEPAVAPARFPGGGAWCWAGPTAVVYAAADGRLMPVPAGGGPAAVLAEGDGRALAPAATPDGSRIAFVLDGPDTCEIVVVEPGASDRTAAQRAVPAARTTRGTRRGRPTARGWPGTSGTSRHVVGRLPDRGRGGPRTRRRARPSDRRRRRVGRGRPAPLLARRRRARVRQRRVRLVERLDRRTRWFAAGTRCSPSSASTPSPPGVPASARSPGRPTAPRSCSTATRTASAASSWPRVATSPASISRGWHHGLDWGPRGIVSVRSGARTPAGVTVLDPSGDRAFRRALARGPADGFEAAGLSSPSP